MAAPRTRTPAPGQFLPLAEEAGLMGELGERVLRDSLAQLARWRAGGLSFSNAYLAVNIASQQLVDDSSSTSSRRAR